jgi:hypothetical protein
MFQKRLADGRTVYVDPLTFGRGRLSVGDDGYTYHDSW